MAAALQILFFLFCATANAAIDPKLAQNAFDALDRNCRRDNGALWGKSLCGNVVLVEKSTREAIGNDGWTGKLPESIGIANTAFDWNGKRWSMVMWPLPSDDGARDRLLIHERFHAIQNDLGIPMASPANDHLDSLRGRYLMRLEMRALSAALLAMRDGKSFIRAMHDAQAFRDVRQKEFPGAAASEAALELNEGLAEYTAVKLFTSAQRAQINHALGALPNAEEESFVRSFAYATGPAWGLLNDRLNSKWRKNVAAKGSMQIEKSVAEDFADRAARYNGAAIYRAELQRDEERRARIKSYERRFVSGPTLQLPLRQMQMQFDPHDVHPFEGHGTVYESITISDEWGKIVVTGGALIAGDYRSMTVTAPDASGASRDWQLTLAPGWVIDSGRVVKRP